jgi:hypothetical protein
MTENEIVKIIFNKYAKSISKYNILCGKILKI